MSFIGDMIEKFAHKEEQQFGAPQGGYGNSGPPQVPPPWIARWDDRDQRWLFINEQTGERTFDFPQQRIEYYQASFIPIGSIDYQAQFSDRRAVRILSLATIKAVPCLAAASITKRSTRKRNTAWPTVLWVRLRDWQVVPF